MIKFFLSLESVLLTGFYLPAQFSRPTTDYMRMQSLKMFVCKKPEESHLIAQLTSCKYSKKEGFVVGKVKCKGLENHTLWKFDPNKS